MASEFSVGDHVGWNSEAGQVSGTITKVHTSDFDYNLSSTILVSRKPVGQ